MEVNLSETSIKIKIENVLSFKVISSEWVNEIQKYITRLGIVISPKEG